MNKFLYFLAIISLSTLMVACFTDEPDPVEPDTQEESTHTVIIYAVASNNLYYDLNKNKQAMLRALTSMNDDSANLLLYEVNNQNATLDEANLYHAEKNADGEYIWKSVKTYSREIYSTNPERIREVLNDAVGYKKTTTYDLFFWSHGTGWTPAVNDVDPFPVLYSFGYDTYGWETDEINIDELAACIPSNQFETIWFDACYMSSIETLYELRDKCKYFVGYPTEIWSDGIPYNQVLPILFDKNHDLKAAATEVYNYYNEFDRAVTVGVYDMAGMDTLADACAKIYKGMKYPKDIVFQDYSRRPYGPFYDFGQYTREVAKASGRDKAIAEFDKALDNFTIYKAASSIDFNRNLILPENYSGMSCYPFEDVGNSETEFYKRLGWYKRVYK